MKLLRLFALLLIFIIIFVVNDVWWHPGLKDIPWQIGILFVFAILGLLKIRYEWKLKRYDPLISIFSGICFMILGGDSLHSNPHFLAWVIVSLGALMILLGVVGISAGEMEVNATDTHNDHAGKSNL
jgi:hypothetical protein